MSRPSLPLLLTLIMGCPAAEPSGPSSETGQLDDSVEATWTLGGVVSCQHTSPMPFSQVHTDVLETVPFDATATELFEGGGLAVVDLNDDGHLDLVLSGADAPALLWGTSKGFTPADASVLPSAPDRGVGVTAADVDGDGDLDLFLARYRRPNLLWRNDGDRFVDITKAAGVSGETNARTVTASFHDIDHDGILDLFVGNFGPFFAQDRPPGEPSELYRGMGDGTFVPWDAPLPAAVQDGYVFNGGWIDIDQDGWHELYTVHDFGPKYPNALLRNDRGILTLDDGLTGLHVGLDGMGLDWGDVDRDGDLDIVIAGWNENRLMLQEEGTFFDAHVARGVRGVGAQQQRIGWSTIFADLDNDGRLDVVEGYGKIYNQNVPDLQPDAVFHQQPDGQFLEVGASWGFAHPGQTRAVVAADLNQDGTLELVRRDLIGPTTIHQRPCVPGSWVTFSLRHPDRPNTHAVGATIRARTGDTMVRADVRAGGDGLFSTRPYTVHMGLGTHETIDVEITWPDGAHSRYEQLQTRQHVRVIRQENTP